MDLITLCDSLLIRMGCANPMLGYLIPMAPNPNNGGSKSNVIGFGTLLTNLIKKSKSWGGGIIIVLGIIMIVVAGFKIGKGLMTQGKPNAQPINWFLCVGLLVVGCMFAFGGFSSLANLAKSTGSTIDDLSGTGDTFEGSHNEHTKVDDGEFY